MTNTTSGSDGPQGRKRFNIGTGARRLLMAGAFGATFLAGGFALSGAGALAADMAMGHAMGGAGMHAMMGSHIDEMLAKVDATADQKARIHEIMKTAMASFGGVHERMAATHADLHRLLTAPTIDRAALEQLRAARMGDFDQASKVMVQAIADSADVLTPAQRQKLGEIMAQHHATH
jgi:Spy/CpxP family protein refolding chaperone